MKKMLIKTGKINDSALFFSIDIFNKLKIGLVIPKSNNRKKLLKPKYVSIKAAVLFEHDRTKTYGT